MGDNARQSQERFPMAWSQRGTSNEKVVMSGKLESGNNDKDQWRLGNKESRGDEPIPTDEMDAVMAYNG
jgi:hypothetical protein